MATRKLAGVCAVLFTLAAGAYAQELSAQDTPWEVGTEIYHFTYHEAGLMKDKGVFYGVIGSYTYYADAFLLRGEGRVAVGQVDYSSPFSGMIDGIDDAALEVRGVGGHEFEMSGGITLTPYGGLAYRYLRDDSSGMLTTFGDAGYLRQSNYLYTPIGVSATSDFGNGWFVGATLEYDFFWYGVQKSDLSDADPSLPNLTNRQHSGYGFRASFNVTKRYERIAFSVEPFVRYWNIEQSNSDQGFIEPKNTTTEAGINLVVEF